MTNSKVNIAFTGSFRSTYEHQLLFYINERGKEDGSKISTQTCVSVLRFKKELGKDIKVITKEKKTYPDWTHREFWKCSSNSTRASFIGEL